ncbi:MAG: ABC transporter permease [Promethearchaeota archaeon]
MTINKKIRRIFSKTFAIAEKNTRMQFRFKYNVIFRWFTPIITILMPIIILDQFFNASIDIYPWNAQNYMIFVFIGYNILLMQKMLNNIPVYLLREKYWKTLPALITAPFNRFYLLFGYILSEFLGIIIPFTIFFVTLLIFFPISITTILAILVMFIGVGIVFSGVGLFLGVFAISNENYLYIFDFTLKLIFWFSCVTYPFQLFPSVVQNIINLNPIYYLIDIIRWTWIENNLILTAISHPLHILIFSLSLVIFPIICVLVFDYIYKKLGITGY